MAYYIFLFFLIAGAVFFGLAALLWGFTSMTKRQQLKADFKRLAEKIGNKAGDYLASHVDEKEKARFLEMLSDNRLTRSEVIEGVKMLLSPNKPAASIAEAAPNKDSPAEA